MKKRIKLIYLIIFWSLLHSCKEEAEKNFVLATFYNFPKSIDNVEVYFVATNEKGELLDWKLMDGSTTITLKAFDEHAFFTFSTVQIFKEGNYKSAFIETYDKIETGYEKSYTPLTLNSLKANVTLNHSGQSYICFGSYQYLHNVTNQVSINTSISFSSAPLLIYRYYGGLNTPSEFKYFDQTFSANGTIHEIVASDGYINLSQQTIGQDVFQHLVVAKPNTNNLSSWIILPSLFDFSEDNQFTYYYPGNTFANYGSLTWFTQQDRDIMIYSKDQIIKTNIPNWNAAVEVENGKIQVAADNTYNFTSIMFGFDLEGIDMNWSLFTENKNGEVAIPQFPNEIKSLLHLSDVNQITTDEIAFITLNRWDNYENLAEQLLNPVKNASLAEFNVDNEKIVIYPGRENAKTKFNEEVFSRSKKRLLFHQQHFPNALNYNH